jgi:hypothetical protein
LNARVCVRGLGHSVYNRECILHQDRHCMDSGGACGADDAATHPFAYYSISFTSSCPSALFPRRISPSNTDRGPVCVCHACREWVGAAVLSLYSGRGRPPVWCFASRRVWHFRACVESGHSVKMLQFFCVRKKIETLKNTTRKRRTCSTTATQPQLAVRSSSTPSIADRVRPRSPTRYFCNDHFVAFYSIVDFIVIRSFVRSYNNILKVTSQVKSISTLRVTRGHFSINNRHITHDGGARSPVRRRAPGWPRCPPERCLDARTRGCCRHCARAHRKPTAKGERSVSR